MSKLLAPFVAATVTCTLATPVLASPYAHGFKYMAQETAPAAAPAPAPAPAPVAQPYPPQPYPPQPYPQQPYAAQPVAPQPYYGPQPYPQQQPYYGPPPAQEVEAPRRRGKGMMVGGWTMLGVSYVFTSLTGAIMADLCKSTAPCRRVGYYMLIPVAGPFIAIGPAESATAKIFLGFTGAIQAAGLIMGIVGTAQYVADGRQARINADGFRVARNLRVNASPTGRHAGAMIDFHYRF